MSNNYEAFLNENFAVEEYARTLLEENACIPEQLAVLANSVVMLDKQLKEQIAVHYEQLLSQATSLESLEDILSTLTHHVSALQCSVDKACDKVSGLHKKTEIRTKQLSRLHETCSLLRNVIRVLQLSSRLQANDSGENITTGKISLSKDLIKSSQIVQELRDISSTEPVLKTLGVVDNEMANVQKWTSCILTSARCALKQGTKSQHQAQVASALQAFHNLKCLRPQLDSYSKELTNEARQILKIFESFSFRDEATRAGDRSTPGAAQSTAGQQSFVGRSSLTAQANAWNDVGRLAEFLVSVCTQLQVLHTVASKKREPELHRFLEDTIGGTEFYASVWAQIVSQIEASFGSSNSIIKQTLESEYPRLLRYMSSVFSKLVQSQNILPDGESQFLSALQSFEAGYLSKSLARLFDSVNLVFHRTSSSVSTSSIQMAQYSAPVTDFTSSKTNESSAPQQCSLYVRELQDFTSRVWRDYLTPFECYNLIHKESAHTAKKTAKLFLVHASLVRPINEHGKMRLIADFVQIELALSSFCHQTSPDDFNSTRQSFHSMRQLLAWGNLSALASTNDPDQELHGVDLPRSIVVHCLIAASPEELPSPHVTAGWSLAKYAEWYVSQPNEFERLQFLRGSLESYTRSVIDEGKTEYVPLYPAMLKLLEQGFKLCSVEQ